MHQFCRKGEINDGYQLEIESRRKISENTLEQEGKLEEK